MHARPFPIVRPPHQARLDRVQMDVLHLFVSDKTNRRSRDMAAYYTAVTRISKRKAAESLNSETLRYPAVDCCHDGNYDLYNGGRGQTPRFPVFLRGTHG